PYFVRDDIGVFLTPDLPRNDLWEKAESGLARYLRVHRDAERRLMEAPFDSLHPTDRFLRMMVLEERGDYAQALAVGDAARRAVYSPDYLACQERLLEAAVDCAGETEGPIVDLASGRGALVEALARRTGRQIVASDFSPTVLRRNRRWLTYLGLHDSVSLLAFDARRTPFKDGALAALTTNLGLPNVEEPGAFLGELRRVVSGRFYAVSHFYPEDGGENAWAIRRMGLGTMLFRDAALEAFRDAGWAVEETNVCRGLAEPTGRSEIVEGMSLDGLPVETTTLEWCLLVAR
ncbi:MAG: class I SAM-dependent methyltransferase, partial [Chloroflexi bacterium]|nr:class I SAM-dependent methyltransferase [Chloroflexota bacterium]